MMKKLFSISLLICLSFTVSAAYLTNLPKLITQPDGKQISCFASGDEFYNYLHDANGYTIVQADNGYFYYGKVEKGQVVPSRYKVGESDPQQTNLRLHAKISTENYQKSRADFERFMTKPYGAKTKDFTHINNVCIYIKFAEDEEFDKAAIQDFDSMFNAQEQSLANYYKTASFGKLTVNTYSLPKDMSTEYISYTDIYPVSYYRPYNATTNPNGYKGSEKNDREWSMLQRAVQWVAENVDLPENIDLDNNEDGFVDNVSFIISAKVTGNEDWGNLLWAHRFQLPPSYPASLNGKRVSTFIFMPQNQANRYTVCHEFFHALDAPDLYHYNSGYTQLVPVGNWDLMESGFVEMSSHMKEKYGGWIDIPTVKSSGYFSLKPAFSGSEGVAYRFPIDNNTSESLVLEYRRKEGAYDSNIPGTGLLVYRVNRSYRGNAEYNGSNRLDELYVFRPEGDLTKNGMVNKANLSDLVGRSEINDNTDPKLFLSKGKSTDVEIYNIKDQDSCLTFNIFMGPNFDPTDVVCYPSDKDLNLSWKKHSSSDFSLVLRIDVDKQRQSLPYDGQTYEMGDIINGSGQVVYAGTGNACKDTELEEGKTYYYLVFSRNSAGKYSKGVFASSTTLTDEVVCDELSNINEQDSLTVYRYTDRAWGTLAGHNSMGRTNFAEKFCNNTLTGMMAGVTLNLSAAHAATTNSSIEIWLADEDAKGLVGAKYYWQTVPISSLRTGENYIAFSTPALAKKDFFVGYTLSYTPAGDTISVYHVKSRATEENTAYLHYNKVQGWISMFEAEDIHTSLDIRPKICTGVGESAVYFEVFPSELTFTNNNLTMDMGVWTNLGLWELSDIPSWLSATKNYATGNIRFTASATTADREGEIKIEVGGQTKNALVKQKEKVSVEKDSEGLSIGVYPNPSLTGIFDLRTPEVSQYEVLDYTGKILSSGRTSSAHTRIDLSQYSSGMYFVKVTSGEKQSVIKLVR